jgi:TonB-linked SusC/RagA family outer membrane protein
MKKLLPATPKKGPQALFFLILTTLFFSVEAGAYEQPKVNVGFRNASMEQVINKLERWFSVQCTYEASILQGEKKINLPEKERTLPETLDQLARITGLQFLQAGNLVGIKRPTLLATGQPEFSAPANRKNFATIRGRVTDNRAQPVAGATVTVKGATGGVTTGADGSFTIEAEVGQILLVSHVGFNSRELAIEANTFLEIALAPVEEQMGEVVVTALGIRKEKRKLTFAAQEVKGAALEKAREPNIASSLTGRVAGLSIRNKSTLFENPEILLRGGSTLLVIDGVPSRGDLWNLNADDIESINVLKGTAATALYGSLGINGAIMITTKKGKAGANGVEVTFNTTNQVQAGFLRMPETQTEYGMGWNGQYAFKDGRGGGLYDDYGYVYGPKLNQKDPTTASGFVEIPQYNSPVDPATGERVPLPWITRSGSNLKKFLNNQFLTTNNISLAGKTDFADYRISFTHMYQKGQVPNTHVNATTLNLAGGLKLTNKLRAEGAISFNKQYTPNYPITGYGPNNFFYNILLWMGPEVDINDMRRYWQPGRENLEQLTYNYTWYNNPWFLANEYLNGYTNDVVTSQANINYEFSKDLSLIVRSGITTNNAFSDTKTPYSFINYGTSKAPFGNYATSQSSNLRMVTDAILTYKKNFLKDFSAVVTVGGGSRYDQSKFLGANTVGGLSVPTNYNLSNSRDPVQSTNNLTEKQVNSAYGTAEIGFKDMVFLNLSGRNDWTSALQKPHNSFFYPSVSLAVIASEMFRLPTAVSFLKLRGAYANISSDVAAYYTLPTYSRGTRWNGVPSLNLPGVLISPDLQPNQTVSQEYGAEVRFLRNRIGIDFTYYNYKDQNFIRDIPISMASGYSSVRVNGDVYNRKGIELVLTGSPVKTANLQWDIALNYSRNRNYVAEYYGGDSLRGGVKLGQRSDVLRGWKWQRSPEGLIIHRNGIPQYINQVVNLGYSNPDWEFGVYNSIRYKNFTLGFSFDGRIGGLLVNGLEAKLYEGGMHKATVNHFRDEAYRGEKTYLGEGAVVTAGTVQYDVQGNVISDSRKFAPNTTKVNYIDWLFATYTNGIDESVLYDRTFVKLREATLTYNFSGKLLQGSPFKGASLSVVGRNLLLWTKVPYMDPDGYSGSDLAEPTYRNIGVNLNLKF